MPAPATRPAAYVLVAQPPDALVLLQKLVERRRDHDRRVALGVVLEDALDLGPEAQLAEELRELRKVEVATALRVDGLEHVHHGLAVVHVKVEPVEHAEDLALGELVVLVLVELAPRVAHKQLLRVDLGAVVAQLLQARHPPRLDLDGRRAQVELLVPVLAVKDAEAALGGQLGPGADVLQPAARHATSRQRRRTGEERGGTRVSWNAGRRPRRPC